MILDVTMPFRHRPQEPNDLRSGARSSHVERATARFCSRTFRTSSLIPGSLRAFSSAVCPPR